MMKMSIRMKVILIIAACLVVGAGALISITQKSYDDNVQLVARQSLDAARASYGNMEQTDYRTLAATSLALVQDGKMRSLFAQRDREGLIKYLDPMYQQLKKSSKISVYTVVDPDRKVFARMLSPEKFGDPLLNYYVLEKAISTKAPAVSSELGKTGYSLRCVSPIMDDTGKLLGYLFLGDTYDSFLGTIKSQTGDDYTMVGIKALCDEKKYRLGQEQKGLKDTWDQFENVVVLSSTVENLSGAKFDGELKNIPAEGKLLGAVNKDGKAFVRGVFPLVDTSGKNIGGVFVTHDVTPLYAGMQKVKTYSMAAVIGLMAVISIAIAWVLGRLVFARLQRTMNVATRMVGGDFESQITPENDDEVGKLETLLEQFRTVFVNTVNDYESQQNENLKKSA